MKPNQNKPLSPAKLRAQANAEGQKRHGDLYCLGLATLNLLNAPEEKRSFFQDQLREKAKELGLISR